MSTSIIVIMLIVNREAYPTPPLADKQIDTSNPYKQPDWVLDSWPKEAIETAEKVYEDFNEEHGTDYKFKLK